MAEKVIYSDNAVGISTARVVISGTTYQLRNITSVKMTYDRPAGCAVLLIALGSIPAAIGAFIAVAIVTDQIGRGFPSAETLFQAAVLIFTPLIVGLAMIAGGRAWARSVPKRYHLMLTTASGESCALTSTQRDYVEKVVEHINEALAAASG